MLKHFSRLTNNVIFKLFVALSFGFLFGKHLPVPVQQSLYAISLTLKECLIFVLPFVIFSCIFSCLLSFKSDVFKFIIVLLLCICLSNFISTMVAYGVSDIAIKGLKTIEQVKIDTQNPLTPYWNFILPSYISNNTALFSGFILGLIFSKFRVAKVDHAANKMRAAVSFFLNKMFIPVLPFFALGFIIKLESDGILSHVAKSYLPIFLVILATLILYISVLYFIGAGFRFTKFAFYLKNALPSGIMGFSTMSSMATLPLTIQAAEKNTGKVDLARTIAPATVNIHLIGDSITITIMALVIMTSFGAGFPDMGTFLIFSVFFVLAKFAVATVPGGGIIVMMAVLETYLGFNSEMGGLITALYILLDPLITVANVMGNGAFVILTTKLIEPKMSKI